MSKAYDIVIFGATGFTGQQIIPSVERLSKENGRSYNWAIAGRSDAKLASIREEVGKKIGKDLSYIPMIIADVKDVDSIDKMTKQARIIINTCGPFRFFGEPVVKACVENSCHHVDISGESYYMEQMQMKYHKQAQEKGVYIVSACGFDSIPNELGLMFLKNKFDGTLNTVESYLSTSEVGGPHPGPLINFTTWESIIHGIAGMSELKEQRAKLFPKDLPELTPKLPSRAYIHKCAINNKYAVPFLGADLAVMQRSQRYMFEEENTRPIQIGTYFCIASFFNVTLYAIMGGIFMMLTKFSFGRSLLFKYPSCFSLGLITHEGPSQEKMENTKFNITLIGEGWATKQEDGNAEFTTTPDKKVIVEVNGTNPAYGMTSVSLTLCALTILDEPSKLPKNGGVYSPGAAFYKTSIFDELHKNGLTFDLVQPD